MAEQQSRALVQSKRTVSDLLNSDLARTEIAKVLPKHLTPDRMTRVALTATLKNPALLNCVPQSLMNALLVCSQAGLEPDGRLAHLIPFGNQVQVIFDYKGLVTLALRNGAESVFAEKVCEKDGFEAAVVDGKKTISHNINWKKDRGPAVCYYAVCKRNGEVDWEVMTLDEVNDIRKRSRAANSGPWVTDFDEMAKKTVLRRMSKRWDLLPEIRDVINADDDTPAPFAASVSAPVFKGTDSKEDNEELYKGLLNGSAAQQGQYTQQNPPGVSTPDPSPTNAVQRTPEAKAKPIEPPPQKPEDASAESFENATPAKPEVVEPSNPLKTIRLLCKSNKPVIREGVLLGFLAEIGITDGSAGSLEELQISQPSVIETVIKNWADMSGRISAALKK